MKSKSLGLSLFILFAWMMPTAIRAEASTCAEKKCSVDCSQSKNTWLPRAFSSYSMHDINQRQSVCDDKDHKINFTFLTEYMQNFGSKCSKGCKNLGAMPFWSGDNTLTIGNNNGKAQLDAYQLGLGNVQVDSDGIAGTIQLNPRVQHVGTDMMMLYQQSKDERGLYFKVHAPLGAMIIDPRLKELSVALPDEKLSFSQVTAAPNSSTITYQFPEYPTPGRRQNSVSEAFFGGVSKGDGLDGNMNKPIRIRKGRIASSKQAVIRMADISTSLGYNVFVNEKGFVGLGFKASMPTGNVPTADYMLEPIFGRAGVWGVGGEVSAAYKVWENQEGTRYLNIQAQGEALHLFSGRKPSYRSFDLKANGAGSKYMLIQEYTAIYSNLNPNTEIYAPQRIQPAVNLTTLPVKSKFAVEGSFAVLFDFHCNDWNMALGGEFWGRSRECLSIDMESARDLRHPDLNNYAVLGRQVSAYRIDDQPAAPVSTYYCEPAAKINKSQDAVQLVGTVPAVAAPASLPEGIKDARLSVNRIPSNLTDALDIAGAQAARAFTGKVTGQIGYTWSERQHMPSVQLIGGAEFTSKTNNAIQLWSVAVQGSVNF